MADMPTTPVRPRRRRLHAVKGCRRPGSRAHRYAEDSLYADGRRRHIDRDADGGSVLMAPVGIGMAVRTETYCGSVSEHLLGWFS